MEKNDWVILKMPSERSKLVKISDGKQSLGKFGSFMLSDLIGYPFGLTFEIIDGKISVIKRNELISLDSDNDVEENNNRNIKDDGKSQLLSTGDIMKVKDQMTGAELAQWVAQNNTSFDQKTKFSKEKFSKQFSALEPSPMTLCQLFMEKNPEKILHLHMDSLGLMLNLANIHQNSKVLLVDETCGMVAGSILKRLHGKGQVLALSETDQSRLDIIEYFNMPAEHCNILNLLPWNRISEHPDEILDEEALKNPRAVARVESIKKSRAMLCEGNFDALVVISRYNPSSIIDVLSKYLAKSRPILVFSQYSEPLVEAFQRLSAHSSFINIELSDLWTRQYQVLKNRTHPLMNMPAPSGHVLFLTYV